MHSPLFPSAANLQCPFNLLILIPQTELILDISRKRIGDVVMELLLEINLRPTIIEKNAPALKKCIRSR